MYPEVAKILVNIENRTRHRLDYCINPYTNKLIQIGGKTHLDLLSGQYLSEWIVNDDEYESQDEYIDSESEFEINSIIEYDYIRKRYLVKWQDNSNTWEPIENLNNCKELLNEFNCRSYTNKISCKKNWIFTNKSKKQRLY